MVYTFCLKGYKIKLQSVVVCHLPAGGDELGVYAMGVKTMYTQLKGKWDKEDWKEASGISCSIHETNAGLVPRDYSVKCEIPAENCIGVIKGHFLWWCSAHHQPYQVLRSHADGLCAHSQKLLDRHGRAAE
jgi:hypothetical protein